MTDKIDTSADAVARRAALQFCDELGLNPHETVYEQRGVSYVQGERLGFLFEKFRRSIAEQRIIDAAIAAIEAAPAAIAAQKDAERDRLADRIRELEAQLAAPVVVKVKPLAWDCITDRVQEAVGFKCRYQVWTGTDGCVRWQGRYMGRWEDAPTVEAAQAAAQADYEARILAALDLTPDPRVTALVGAAESQLSALAAYMSGGDRKKASLALTSLEADDRLRAALAAFKPAPEQTPPEA